MSKFSEVFRNRNFTLLWIGQIISQLGDRLDQMALIALVYSRAPGSAVEIAKILSFTIIPVFLIGPVAGVYVDRWERRRTMYVSDFLRALLVLLIPLFFIESGRMLPVYLIIFLVFCIGRFFVPAKLSIIPDLVDKDDLVMANSLVNTTGMIAAILGFGVSGVVVEWLGAKGGFYLDSLSFLLSAACIYLIAKKPAAAVSLKRVGQEIVEVIRSSSVLQELKDGVGYFLRNRDIRSTAGTLFILWAALGSVYVVIIAFVQQTLGSVTKDLGFLAMFLGAGLFLGSLVYGKLGQRLPQMRMIFAALVFSGLMLVVFAQMLQRSPHFSTAAVLAVLLGIVIAPIMIASNTIVHNASSDAMRGKVFSSFEIVMHLAFLLFMFLSSYLAERVSPGRILSTVGVLVALAGSLNFLLHFRERA